MQFILLQVVTFVVLVVVFYALFGTQLKNALGRLQVLHQESLEKESILNKELERAKIQSQNEIVRGKEEAKKIVDEARQKAQKIFDESGDQAKAEAEKVISSAQERLSALETEMQKESQQKSVEMAQELIKMTFSDVGIEGLQGILVEELISELKKIDGSRLNIKAESGQIQTPFPLSTEKFNSLVEIISSKIGRSLAFEAKVEPTLVAGVVIKLGGLVVDASLKNKMTKALRLLNKTA